MNREEITAKVSSIISETVDHHNFIISDDLVASDVDGWTSLANAMIIQSIEMEFGLKFKFVDLMNWKKFKDLIDIIEFKLR